MSKSPWKVELFYRLVSPFRKAKPQRAMQNILIYNSGRLGDVFIASTMLHRLKDFKVSMLVTPEGKAAAEGCPGVENVHVIRPWYRSQDPQKVKLQKALKFQKEKRELIEEFSKYDTVLHTHPHFSGITSLFPEAYQVGFETPSDRNLFSQICRWDPELYLVDQYQRLLDQLGVPKGDAESPWSSCVAPPLIQGKYIVMHIGASDAGKDYSTAMWKKVYLGLKDKGHKIYFTGKGQSHLIEPIVDSADENLCDELNWLQFLSVIARSDLVISVDTVALHVASAFKRPLIALYRDAPDHMTWCPK